MDCSDIPRFWFDLPTERCAWILETAHFLTGSVLSCRLGTGSFVSPGKAKGLFLKETGKCRVKPVPLSFMGADR